MTRALIVIDVQESFRRRESWAAVSQPDVVGQVNRLVDHARERGDLVIWVLHSEPGTDGPFDPVHGFVRLVEGLEPRPGEPVLTKYVHNAFTTTNLGWLLTSAGVTDVAVCGIRTEQCCETTARLASDLGHRVTFVVDATATMPIEHPDATPGRPWAEVLADPRTLGTDAIVERTVYALAGRFADVVTVDEVVGARAMAH